MPSPPFKVEIALTSSPAAPLASQTWTDVTAWVLTTGDAGAPIDIRYGRADEDAQVVPATCSLRLDNTDGRWTPRSTTAPPGWLGNITVGRPIRVTVTSGADYRRFTGHVGGWEIPEWAQAGGHKIVEVTATDRLQRLSRGGLFRSVLETETLRTDPRAYWPLGEPAGAGAAESTTPTPEAPLTVKQRVGTGMVEFGGGTGVGTDGLPAPLVTPTVDADDPAHLVGNAYLGGTLSPAVSWGGGAGLNGITLGVWFSTFTIYEAPNLATLLALENPGVFYVDLTIDDTGTLIGTVADLAGGITKTVTGPMVGTDRTLFVALIANPGGNLTLRVYREGVGNFSYLALSLPSTARTASVVTVGDSFGGTISHAAVWDRVLTTDELDVLWAGRRALAGTNTGTAVETITRYAGVPTVEVAAETGVSTIGSLATQGRSSLAVLQEIEAAEGGVIFAGLDGVIRFHSRAHRLNPGAPALTIAAATGDPIYGLGFRLDDQDLVNDATIGRSSGAAYRVVDAASITAHGVYAETTEINVGSDVEAAGRAAYRVAAYATPLVRANAFSVNVTTAATPATWLDLDLGDLIAITGLTTDKPALGSLWVEGWQEQIGVNGHVIAFNTSPVLLPGVTFFVIGTSSVGGPDVLAY